MSDFLYQLNNALSAHNISIKGNIRPNIDRIQRFKDLNSSHGGKDIFIALHGDKGATFGDWHDQSGWVTWWMNSTHKISLEERREREYQRMLMDELNRKRRDHAVKRAEKYWLSCIAEDTVKQHHYILKKKINPYYAKSIVKNRWIKNILLIPVRDIDYQFQSVQIIKSNGFKRLWKGTSSKNNMIWLSLKLPENYNGVIRVCEGYATGCTIFQVTQQPVICAINAYNMVDIITQLKRRYIHANIKICADNDGHLTDNIGLKMGRLASGIAAGNLHYPIFNSGEKPSDFNDLYCLMGKEECKKQLIAVRR